MTATKNGKAKEQVNQDSGSPVLSEPLRAVLTLLVQEDSEFSDRQIAAALNISFSTMRKRLAELGRIFGRKTKIGIALTGARLLRNDINATYAKQKPVRHSRS